MIFGLFTQRLHLDLESRVRRHDDFISLRPVVLDPAVPTSARAQDPLQRTLLGTGARSTALRVGHAIKRSYSTGCPRLRHDNRTTSSGSTEAVCWRGAPIGLDFRPSNGPSEW